MGTRARLSFLAIIVMTRVSLAASEAQVLDRLPELKILENQVSVSGSSSGAAMAIQLAVANSKELSGIGSISGVVYGCSEGKASQALDECMKSPQKLNASHFVEMARMFDAGHLIDSVANIKKQRVFIYAGTKDTVVAPAESEIIHDFYSQLGQQENIKIKFDLPAQHGQPTLEFGNACAVLGSPWLQSCGYDAAGEILQHLYPDLKEKGSADEHDLYSFDQTSYVVTGNSMETYGFVYIPRTCMAGATCRLHVALHGCKQGHDFRQAFAAYTSQAGYNPWAEKNNLVILYPTLDSDPLDNPNGCWDWWGYSTHSLHPDMGYSYNRASQIMSIIRMVKVLEGHSRM